MKIVGKDKEAVERAIAVLQYKDYGMKGSKGLYRPRIFSCYTTEEMYMSKTGLFVGSVSGDCAWSVKCCMAKGPMTYYADELIHEPKFHVFKDWQGHICYANILTHLQDLCKELGVACEIYSEEPGCEFQEHWIVDHLGNDAGVECVPWKEGYDTDEEGNWVGPNPEKNEGGFGDQYCKFLSPESLYNIDYDDMVF